ncbi:MAG: hypothetical protein QM496_01025 [Verrucomicrobiota bacterium]
MAEGISWNSVVVLEGECEPSENRKVGATVDDEVLGRSTIYVGVRSINSEKGQEKGGITHSEGRVFIVSGDEQEAVEELKAVLADFGITAPLFCLADSVWMDYFSTVFSPGKFAIKGWCRSEDCTDNIAGIKEYEFVSEGVLAHIGEQFPTSRKRSESCPLKVLMLINPASLYVNTTLDYCEAFDLFSKHRFSFVSSRNIQDVNQVGEPGSGLDYSNYDVLMIHYSVRIALWKTSVDRGVMESIQKFTGYKILFIQDEYDCTESARERIVALGINEVFTCVPEKFVERVYPKEQLPGVKFNSCLTGYLPPMLDGMRFMRPLAERTCRIVYRGRSLPYYYGDLGQEKLQIGKRVKEVCEKRSISHDIEWAEDKRIYGGEWIEFLQSGRATLGSESGSNVFDVDGTIREQVNKVLGENPDLSYDEVRESFFEEGNLNVEMNQISPKIFEFIASRTALILYEGSYSGILQPSVHYLSLKKDASNLDEILVALEDLPRLEEMTERAYKDVVTEGLYSYQNFVRGIDLILDKRETKAWVEKTRGKKRSCKVAPPITQRKLCESALEFTERIRANHLGKVRADEVAHLKSKKGNFHGMLLRRKEKTTKLHAKLGKCLQG